MLRGASVCESLSWDLEGLTQNITMQPVLREEKKNLSMECGLPESLWLCIKYTGLKLHNTGVAHQRHSFCNAHQPHPRYQEIF